MRPSDTYFFPILGGEQAPQVRATDQDNILHDAATANITNFSEAFFYDDLREEDVSLSPADRLKRELSGGTIFFDYEGTPGWTLRDKQPTTVTHGLPYDHHRNDDGTYGVSTFALLGGTHDDYKPILVLLYTHRDRLDLSRLTPEEIRRSYPALIGRSYGSAFAVYQKDYYATEEVEDPCPAWYTISPDQAKALQTELARYWDTLRSQAIDPNES